MHISVEWEGLFLSDSLFIRKILHTTNTQVHTEDMVTRTSLIYYLLQLAFTCTGTHNLSVTFTHAATPASHHKHGDSGWSCVCLSIKPVPLIDEFRVKLSLSHTQTTDTHTHTCLSCRKPILGAWPGEADVDNTKERYYKMCHWQRKITCNSANRLVFFSNGKI